MDKDKLVDNIKEWIRIDNELRELQKASKERRERKKELTGELVDVMKSNEIDCFDTKDGGKLIYAQNKVKASLNKKYLFDTITNYFKDDPVKAKELGEFIMNNRETKIKESIRRKISKN
jgi:hypothetical protein